MEKLNFVPMGSWDGKYDPMALVRMRVDTFNQTEGTETDYQCDKCRNKGAIAFVTEEGTMCTRACDCMKIRRSIRNANASGFGENFRRQTFGAYEAREPWQQELKQGAMDFADNPQGWFLICGQSGSGKSHLCNAIGRERLLRGDQVRYFSWREQVGALKSLDNQEQRNKLMESLKKAQILCVDDLFKTGAGPDGTARPTAADVNIAFELLGSRYNQNLTTVISTEKTPEELLQVDEAVGGRIAEKARAHTFIIRRDPARNYRLRQARVL